MIYHILNGDALTDRFLNTGLKGEKVIMRECLIEGPLEGDTLPVFFETRAKFIGQNYHGNYNDFIDEINKILNAPDHSEFNLWFGYDLFCQANLWFLLSLINALPSTKRVFIIYPSYLPNNRIWEEYGPATVNELQLCYENRISVTDKDLLLGKNLWNAYKENNLETLKDLSQSSSTCFPYLQEVCIAHIQRFDLIGRPEKVIKEIAKELSPDFITVFKEFGRREGIYGFGDSQLRNIYNKIIPSVS